MNAVRFQVTQTRSANRLNTNVEVWNSNHQGIRCLISGRFVLLSYDTSHYILTHEQILLAHTGNELSELALILAYADLESGKTLPDGHLLRVKRFISGMRKVLERHDHNAYTFFKALSALAIGEALKRNEDWVNESLILTVWEKLASAKLVNGIYEDSSWHEIFQESDTNELFLLSGLVKILGHLSIDSEVGLKKVHDQATKDIFLSHQSAAEVRNMILKDHC